MENHNLLLKVSRLFPSSFNSCQFRTLPDVADSSIIITKTNKIPHVENDHSNSLLQNPPKPQNNYSAVPKIKPCSKSSRNQLSVFHSSDAEGRKCPPVTPVSTLNPNKIVKVKKCSSSSNSGRWFTSSDERTRAAADGFETDTFYSLSSNSGDSFRVKTTSRRFRKCEEMKSIDETGRCSFSSYDTVPSKCSRKTETCGGAGAKTTAENKNGVTWPEYEPGSDHASTQLYYHNSFRSRKTAKSRRKTRKIPSFFDDSMIEEGFAVEKSSSDPYSDFMASMVEMIIEKQMFGAEDLDRLLFCFLSLNKLDFHGIIFEVFSEICQTLFCN